MFIHPSIHLISYWYYWGLILGDGIREKRVTERERERERKRGREVKLTVYLVEWVINVLYKLGFDNDKIRIRWRQA